MVENFAFDKQHCVSIPYFNTSVAFYKGQPWTYNLAIHNLVNSDNKCYMMHEAEGGHVAN